ncbi:MAG: hypothetical protein ACRDZX_09205 [Acidimicrobiales bacterium]
MTSAPGTTTTSTTLPAQAAASPAGYWMVTNAGSVAAFGGAPYSGSLDRALRHPIVAMATAAGGHGYWLADADGTVFDIGGAPHYGSLATGGVGQANPVVGMASTPDHHGYWLVTAAGGVFTFGGAKYHGSMGLSHLNSPVVGMVATPSGQGYWLVSADGGIFAFGNAGYLGSAEGPAPSEPVVGMAATPDGNGYRLVTSRGSVYDFGDARSLGKAPATGLLAPIVGIATAPRGQGYWLWGTDGRILSFGSAPFRGSGQGTLPYGQKVVAMVLGKGRGDGVESAGAFGPDSPSSLKPPPTAKPKPKEVQPKKARAKKVEAKKARQQEAKANKLRTKKAQPKKAKAKQAKPDKLHPKPARSAPVHAVGPKAYPEGAKGYDISWPQCHGAFPPHSRVAVVGVNGGWAFTGNPCFTNEARWAGPNLSTYINLNSPRGSDSRQWATGPAGRCARGDLYCKSYNYGYNTALFSVGSAVAHGAHSKTWWLDVETAAPWSSSQRANARVVAGAIAALRADRLNPAVYSTTYQWDIITGGYVPGTRAWYPTGVRTNVPVRWCRGRSFAGGPVSLVQSAAGRFDGDYSC